MLEPWMELDGEWLDSGLIGDLKRQVGKAVAQSMLAITASISADGKRVTICSEHGVFIKSFDISALPIEPADG